MPLTARRHFELARGLLGTYVALHFAMLWPYSDELFSSRGMLPSAAASPLSMAFPNLLTWFDAPWMARFLVGLGALAGILLLSERSARPAALVAYYVWACLFGRNPLIANPSLPYVGLMLLVVACVDVRRLSEAGPGRTRHLRVLWVAMCLGYSYSGFTKLPSPSWADGQALHYVLVSPLARPSHVRALLLTLPDGLLQAASFGTLALELCFLPLALFERARPWLWSAMLALHVALIACVQFADLSIAMVLLHVFAFDPRWLARGDASTHHI
ncbi:MAG: hypothetical protein QM778_17120 [Myxococcales bacterium]